MWCSKENLILFQLSHLNFMKDLLHALLTFEIEDLVQAITDRLPLLMLWNSFKQFTSLPKPYLIRESYLFLPLSWLHWLLNGRNVNQVPLVSSFLPIKEGRLHCLTSEWHSLGFTRPIESKINKCYSALGERQTNIFCSSPDSEMNPSIIMESRWEVSYPRELAKFQVGARVVYFQLWNMSTLLA